MPIFATDENAEPRAVFAVGDGTDFRLVASLVSPGEYYVHCHNEGRLHHAVRPYSLDERAAMQMARRVCAFYKGLYNIRKNGRAAAASGEPRRCPIEDSRTWRGSFTWNRPRVRQWYAGYDEQRKEMGG